MEWTRSSTCKADSPMCVEVKSVPGGVMVRNSTQPSRHMGFTSDEWRVFVEGVKAGDFD